MFCSSCGSSLKSEDKFCWSCGAKTVTNNDVTVNVSPTTEEVFITNSNVVVENQFAPERSEYLKTKFDISTQEYFEAFIGVNKKAYVKHFNEFVGLEHPTLHWSWAGFFVPTLLFIYRKMYLNAFVFYVFSMISLYILGDGMTENNNMQIKFGLILLVICRFYVASTFTAIYFKHYSKVFRRMIKNDKIKNKEDAFAFLTKSGGALNLKLIISVILAIIIMFLIFTILGKKTSENIDSKYERGELLDQNAPLDGPRHKFD